MKKFGILCLFVLVISLLGACSDVEEVEDQEVILYGESKEWRVDGYKLNQKDGVLTIGDGGIEKIEDDNYKTGYFRFELHQVKGVQDDVLHVKEIKGEEETILGKVPTGSIESDEVMNGEGYYMVIYWNDNELKAMKRDKVELIMH